MEENRSMEEENRKSMEEYVGEQEEYGGGQEEYGGGEQDYVRPLIQTTLWPQCSGSQTDPGIRFTLMHPNTASLETG